MVATLAFKYQNLTIGEGTDYAVTVIEGLDSPDSREDHVDKALEHGSFPYAQYLEARRITFEGFCVSEGPAALDALKNSMFANVVPQAAVRPLIFRLAGDTHDKRVWCVPTKRHFPYNNDYTLGYGEWALEFFAGDPRIYHDTESFITTDDVADNEGTFPTYPVVTITGGSNNPRIENADTGEFLQLNTTSVGGDVIVIDFLNKTIQKNNVSIYSTKDTLSEWWDLEPGDNNIVFTGITGTKELRWRSAWI